MHSPATQRLATKSVPKIIRSLSYLFPTCGSDSLAIVAFTQVWTPIKDCPICDVHFTLSVTRNCWGPITWFFSTKTLYICTTQTKFDHVAQNRFYDSHGQENILCGTGALIKATLKFQVDRFIICRTAIVHPMSCPANIVWPITLHPMWRFEQKRPVCVSQSQEWSLTVGNSGDDDGRMSLDKSLCIPCTTNRRSYSSAVQRLCEVSLSLASAEPAGHTTTENTRVMSSFVFRSFRDRPAWRLSKNFRFSREKSEAYLHSRKSTLERAPWPAWKLADFIIAFSFWEQVWMAVFIDHTSVTSLARLPAMPLTPLASSDV